MKTLRGAFCTIIIVGVFASCDRPECPRRGPAMLTLVADTLFLIRKAEVIVPDGRGFQMKYAGIQSGGPGFGPELACYYYELPLKFNSLEIKIQFMDSGVNHYRLDYQPILAYNETCKFMNYTIEDEKLTVLREDTSVSFKWCYYGISAFSGFATRYNDFNQTYEHGVEVRILK